ncbi:MAG: hypothetical protein HQK88_04825 [Nitrospirae bacterium]|nr:hypothetical protein [Nitrospirota bacterium]MBF0533969.1 hypothetical protein [Nitrospirota bacterium]MBF0616128.1 hypothetical protein [Nitrospirota bacterium]
MKKKLSFNIVFENGSINEQDEVIDLINETVEEFKKLKKEFYFIIDFKAVTVAVSKMMGTIGKASTQEIVTGIDLINVQPQIKNTATRFNFIQDDGKIRVFDLLREDSVEVVE